MTVEQQQPQQSPNTGSTTRARNKLRKKERARLRTEVRAEEQAKAREEVQQELHRGLRAILASDASNETKLAMIAAITSSSTPEEDDNDALALFNVALGRLSRGSMGQARLAVWAKAGESLFLGGDLPSRQAVMDRASQIMFFAGFHEGGGTISGVAATLGTSRRALRNMMKRTKLYEPWQAGEFGITTSPHQMIGTVVQPLDAPVVVQMLTEGDTPQVAGEVQCIDFEED